LSVIAPWNGLFRMSYFPLPGQTHLEHLRAERWMRIVHAGVPGNDGVASFGQASADR
jgi:hypothetical protein